MRETAEWIDHRVVDGGVIERSFRLTGAAGPIPGMLWLPPRPNSPPPLVLLGHGGSGHKRSGRIADLAHWFAACAGLAALAIDGPHHGERVPAPLKAAEYQALIVVEGIETVLDRMASEWRAALRAVSIQGTVDTDHVGYLGLSMGTRFGLPLAATMGDELRCVVFGKFGLQQGPAMHKGLEAPERVLRDARLVTAPALFHLQWHDEIFPRDGQLALFDVLGSRDKQLIGYAGGHAETKSQAIVLWRDFIRRHLTPGRADDCQELSGRASWGRIR
ncbi:dienelactone hydrolase family protein [Micromonospora aurantiaca (nom. illeg.)]|uniref:hypothetical protein n=1 Tax=Micromonospora aurantiaca (nom. illeg.) TaxID=47850 RepID=UPI0037A64719